MRDSIHVNLVFEDAISEYVMEKILNTFPGKYSVYNTYSSGGFGYIKANVNGFNEAAVAMPFFVLTDLDDYECPITLMRSWLQKPLMPNMIFRVAIREVETWLLADIEGFSKFTGVSHVNFPAAPELERDPKQTLINIVRRSRKRSVREDIVPIDQYATIGPNYNERLMEFVAAHWDIRRAMDRSDSLRRAYKRLENYTYLLP